MTVDHTDLISEEYNCMSPGSSQETSPQPVRCFSSNEGRGNMGLPDLQTLGNTQGIFWQGQQVRGRS